MPREPDCGHLALIASGEARGLCPLCLRGEVERLTERGMEAEAWYNQLRAEIDRLREALQIIDGINDNPADFNLAIDVVLRAALKSKP